MVVEIEGVVNEGPFPIGEPPDEALNQKIESAAVAVNVTVPVPQCEPEVGTGCGVIFIVAVTGVLVLLHPLPDACA